MFRYISIFAFGICLAFGQNGPKAEDSKNSRRPASSSQATPAATAPVTIPAGAAETSPGVYKHTDSSGKKWVYRKTPFGIVKFADDGAVHTSAAPEPGATKRDSPFAGGSSTAKTASAPPLTKAVEDGDTIRFERTTPFGPTRWTRKRSELSAEETQILEQSRTAKSEGAGNR